MKMIYHHYSFPLHLVSHNSLIIHIVDVIWRWDAERYGSTEPHGGR